MTDITTLEKEVMDELVAHYASKKRVMRCSIRGTSFCHILEFKEIKEGYIFDSKIPAFVIFFQSKMVIGSQAALDNIGVILVNLIVYLADMNSIFEILKKKYPDTHIDRATKLPPGATY